LQRSADHPAPAAEFATARRSSFCRSARKPHNKHRISESRDKPSPDQRAMITIHHLGVSQSDRIVWLMEELGLPYELKWYRRGPDRLAPSDFLALHPAATAPIIQDGDTVLAESGAIVEYICHRYAGGRLTVGPDDSLHLVLHRRASIPVAARLEALPPCVSKCRACLMRYAFRVSRQRVACSA